MTLLPSTKLYVMKLLHRHPGSYALQLVRHSEGKLKRGSVYVMLSRLLTDGMVVCQVVDNGQKKHSGHRKPKYSLTAQGEGALKEWTDK